MAWGAQSIKICWCNDNQMQNDGRRLKPMGEPPRTPRRYAGGLVGEDGHLGVVLSIW